MPNDKIVDVIDNSSLVLVVNTRKTNETTIRKRILSGGK
jgi:hypothetical protein